ncbi:MAG: DJ-1/PfpI family protein [Opitutaceae bacterium]|nr:DJ-1/PfpI family protein [Opitutaceae bacterium]
MSLLLPVLLAAHDHAGAHGSSPAAAANEAGATSIYTEERPLVVGVIVFEGYETLDVFGPVQIFGGLGRRAKLVTIAETIQPVHARFGPAVVPDHTFETVGPLDVLLIPGGMGTRREVDNTAFIAAIRRLSESAPLVSTVCTGSALLARTGLLSGHKATTNKRAFQWVVAQDRTVNWIHEARWVEDGRYATSSGVSAGIDMSLGLVARLFDRKTAQSIADSAEYVWNDDSTKDPFSALNAHTATNDPSRRWPLRGVIVDVLPARSALLVRHEEIPGIMPAMTMSLGTDEETVASAKKGTAIEAQLYQQDGEWRIDGVKAAAAAP